MMTKVILGLAVILMLSGCATTDRNAEQILGMRLQSLEHSKSEERAETLTVQNSKGEPIEINVIIDSQGNYVIPRDKVVIKYEMIAE